MLLTMIFIGTRFGLYKEWVVLTDLLRLIKLCWCINFWPAESYEEFLSLRKRVEERMAFLSIVGAEIDPDISPDMSQITEGNPLLSHQEEKMLEQLQISWDDIEDNKEVLGFDKLSLETFRQELFELYQQKRKELEAIPNGVLQDLNKKLILFLLKIILE